MMRSVTGIKWMSLNCAHLDSRFNLLSWKCLPIIIFANIYFNQKMVFCDHIAASFVKKRVVLDQVFLSILFAWSYMKTFSYINVKGKQFRLITSWRHYLKLNFSTLSKLTHKERNIILTQISDTLSTARVSNVYIFNQNSPLFLS